MTNRLEAKIEKALKDIKKMEKASLIMNEKGFHVAFSGGKGQFGIVGAFQNGRSEISCRNAAYNRRSSGIDKIRKVRVSRSYFE